MEAQFFRFLKIVGVGYKARVEAAGRVLYLKVGCNQEIEVDVPPAVRVFCLNNNVICCAGLDKQTVHRFAGTVRSCKPPEKYKARVCAILMKLSGTNGGGIINCSASRQGYSMLGFY